jgi:thioredoxin reductase
LNYLLIDRGELGGTISHYPRRKLVMTQPLDLPLYGRLKKDEYSKEFLMEVWHQARRDYGLKFKGGEPLENLEQLPTGFVVKTSKEEHHSRYVMIAIGRRGTPRQLGVDGEELPKVMYQLVDAQAYNGMDLLVVGGGDSAVEAAVGLSRQNGNRVTISYRRSGFSRVKKKNEDRINDAIKAGLIKPLFNSNVTVISPSEVTLSTATGEINMVNDYVFVFAGGIPPYEQLKGYGIKFGGEIPKDATQAVESALT